MANGLAGLIANPRMADVAGGMRDYEVQQQQNLLFQQKQDELARQQRARGLAGAVLGQQFGGQMGELAQVDPSMAIELSNALGVPVSRADRLKSIGNEVNIAQGMASAGDIEGAYQFLQQSRDQKRAMGINTPVMDEALSEYELGPVVWAEGLAQLDSAFQASGLVDARDPIRKTELLSQGGVITVRDSGVEVTDASGNTLKGAKARDYISKQRAAESQAKLDAKQKEADIAVSKAERTENVKLRAKRISDIKAVFGENRRLAARSYPRIREALVLAQKADQGLSGVAQTKLAQLIPGIDVTDEAALDSVLKSLALEQLQAFKGPTTDYEFGVVQSISGELGNSKAANVARLKALDRARWFAQREAEQFDRFIKQGGDPEDYAFDFGETVKTKKGTYSLQDLRDTAADQNMTMDEVIRRLNK